MIVCDVLLNKKLIFEFRFDIFNRAMNVFKQISNSFLDYISIFRNDVIVKMIETLIFEIEILDNQSRNFFVKTFEKKITNFEFYLSSKAFYDNFTNRLFWLMKHKSQFKCILFKNVKNINFFCNRIENYI